MERDGESPVENTSESSPLIQQTSAAGPQSPVPLSIPMPVSEVGTNQEVTQGEFKMSVKRRLKRSDTIGIWSDMMGIWSKPKDNVDKLSIDSYSATH